MIQSRVERRQGWFGESPYYGPLTLDQVMQRVKALAEVGSVEVTSP